jgi:glucose uptake protein GlcU
MGIFETISAIIRLILLIVSVKLEKNKQRKEKMENAVRDIKEGIRNNNPSTITAAFDRLNRLYKRK